jgi:hypothetical protein
LAIHAKGGESISPKQKDRTTTLILKWFSIGKFQIGILLCSKGEQVVFSKIDVLKPSWTLRGEFIEGEFWLVKGKAFETRGENFKTWKCFAKSYLFTFDYIAKGFWKGFTKRILQKQNMWCKRGPKC